METPNGVGAVSKEERCALMMNSDRRKIIEIGGNSWGVTLDKDVLAAAGVEPGDEIAIHTDPDGDADMEILFPGE